AYFLGGVIMFFSFFIPGGAAKSGWTSYSPLATVADLGHHPNGQTFWILGMVFLITSSLLGAVNFIATIIQLRAKGMTLMRLPFIVWAHHMYLTGMGTKIATFFQTTTMIISIPSVIILTCFFISLWGGSIRFTVPMLFALAFLPMFGIGGLTGLPLGFNFTDLHLHDTYYVIAHFHYVVAPGTIFGLFAGIYYWYPKATGRVMSEFWGKVHFWTSLIFMNLIFQPMFAQGMAGLSRRMYDGGVTYAGVNAPALGVVGVPQIFIDMNRPISWAAWCLGLVQIPFIINFFVSLKKGKPVASDNPWGSTTLEWQTPTPPPHGNFDRPMEVHRGPYEYSVPGHSPDFTPQNESEKRQKRPRDNSVMDIPFTVKLR